MVIKRPAGGDAARLVNALVSGAADAAEAAAARLVVLGERATPHVLQSLAQDVPDAGAVRLVTVLGQLPPSRDVLAGLDAAMVDAREAVVAAAIDAYGARLAAADATVAAHALDRLTEYALDAERPGPQRAHAVRLLVATLPPIEIDPLLVRLSTDPAPEVQAAANPTPAATGTDPLSPSADAEDVRQHVAKAGNAAPLPDLHRLVLLARDRGDSELADAPRWLAVRAAVHDVLAHRGSTVALYDLRELIGSAKTPPPIAALSALTLIGDASCVDAVVEAYDRIDDGWTREQLVKVFGAIVARAGLGRRHAAIRRLVERDHPLVATLPAKKPK